MSDRTVRVLSVGSALPGPPIDTAALAVRFGTDRLWRQWVDTFIGTRTRHLAVDLATGRPGQSWADLGEIAAARALAGAGLGAGDVDLVVLGTATPDTLMPATVNVIADRLRVDGIPTFQLQSGCSGAVQTVDVASPLPATGRAFFGEQTMGRFRPRTRPVPRRPERRCGTTRTR